MFLIKEYNVKKRLFGNGLTEIQLFKKSVRIGHSNNFDVKNEIEKVENPFDDNTIILSKKQIDSCRFSDDIKNENLYRSLRRTKSKVFDYSNANDWEWFCTFTISSEKVSDRSDYAECSKKMTNWLNNMKKRYCPDLKYVLVPERHKDGSWHFHGLFRDCLGFDFKIALNGKKTLKNGKINKSYGKPLKHNGKQVYNISRYTLGYTECTAVLDTRSVSKYILKYITKDLISDTANRKRYWNSQNLKTPVESVELLYFDDYNKLVQEFFSSAVEKNPQAYCRTSEICHGEFENSITYITY